MNLWKTEGLELRRRVEALEANLKKLLESSLSHEQMVGRVEGTLADVRSEVAREKLSMAELYDKTYHLLKRHEARDRAARTEPEDVDVSHIELVDDQVAVGDPVTERVLARRRGTGGVSPVLPR
jgi:hypothetical protein